MATNAEGGPKPGPRWTVPLGQAVGLIGVMIAALGLYMSYADRQRDKREAAQQAAQQAQVQTALILRGEGGGNHIRLEPANPNQLVQSQVFYFPSAVRAGAVHITGGGHVDAGWFADGLKKALHGAADGGGERDMPVGIVTTFVADGVMRTDSAVYELGFSVHPRLLQTAEVQIEGVAVGRRGVAGSLQDAVDAEWSRQAP